MRLTLPAQSAIGNKPVPGRKDGSHNQDAPARVSNFGDNVRVVELGHVGHFGDLEDPGAVFSIFTDWVDGAP
jgi:hypothetical protein